MSILITGAAGFIGSQLAYRLKKMGQQLILIDNFSYGSKDNLIFDDYNFEDEIINMDIRDRDGISRLFENNDIKYVYHIAGIAPLPDCQSSPQEAVDVNVTGTVNLLENMRKYGAEKMIFASTNAMYENSINFPTAEHDFGLPTLIYPNTKYTAERFCESFCDTYQMNVTCLRFANVYGPHIDCLRKQPPFVGYMIRELYNHRIPFFHSDGTQQRDYVYIDDLLDLAIAVQKSQGFDVVNVSSNQSYSVNDMYAIAKELMNIDIPPQYRSSIHYWDKYPELFEGRYPIQPHILEHEVTKYTRCNNSYAKEKYGWEPKTLIREGLRKVIEYEVQLLDSLEKNPER